MFRLNLAISFELGSADRPNYEDNSFSGKIAILAYSAQRPCG
jgi:hypothetical protein